MALRWYRMFQKGGQFVRMYSNGSSKNVVGFIGLGNMGLPMARNLLAKGQSVLVYDKVEEQVQKAVKDGAIAASRPADIAQQTTTICTMLPASEHVRQVYTGDNGIFSAVQSGSLLIDCSTIAGADAIEMSDLAKEKGAQYLDAPVSGGVGAATNGVLTFMVGGLSESFDHAKPVLDLMGKNVIHCGSHGAGQATKICNNMLLAIAMIGTSEVLHLAQKLGLDPKLCSQVVNISSGRCWSSDTYNPCPGVMEGVPSSRNYEGGFGTALMRKDLNLAQNAAINTKSITPMGSLALHVYNLMCQNGYDNKDFSSVYKFLEET